MSGEVSIADTSTRKTLISDSYNYTFNKVSGEFHRWGFRLEDDPEFSPFGPEIVDIEISTICHQNCGFCYKSNDCNGHYMSFATFAEIFNKLPKTVTQIAFGIGDIDSNPDLYAIMRYCRANGVIPNITINGSRMKEEDYKMLSSLCGSVAVSMYSQFECMNVVHQLRKHGLHQVNVHCLVSEETFEKCVDLLDGWTLQQPFIKEVNAVVFLMLKPVGKGNVFRQITKEHFETLIDRIKEYGVPAGFDSCSAPSVMRYMSDRSEYIEPCESTLFSMYINVDGDAYPCSFTEDLNGVNVIGAEDFLSDVWNSWDFREFRDRLIKNKDKNGCRKCPVFDLDCCRRKS